MKKFYKAKGFNISAGKENAASLVGSFLWQQMTVTLMSAIFVSRKLFINVELTEKRKSLIMNSHTMD